MLLTVEVKVHNYEGDAGSEGKGNHSIRKLKAAMVNSNDIVSINSMAESRVYIHYVCTILSHVQKKPSTSSIRMTLFTTYSMIPDWRNIRSMSMKHKKHNEEAG